MTKKPKIFVFLNNPDKHHFQKLPFQKRYCDRPYNDFYNAANLSGNWLYIRYKKAILKAPAVALCVSFREKQADCYNQHRVFSLK